MAKGEYASTSNPPAGVCRKLLNAFSVNPVVWPLRSLTFRQQRQDALRTDTDPEYSMVVLEKDTAAASANKTAVATSAPAWTGKVDVEHVPALQPWPAKDINDKVEDYIKDMKNKFHGNSALHP